MRLTQLINEVFEIDPRAFPIDKAGVVLAQGSEDGEEWEVFRKIGDWIVQVRNRANPSLRLELSRRKSGRWARIGKSSHEDYWYLKN